MNVRIFRKRDATFEQDVSALRDGLRRGSLVSIAEGAPLDVPAIVRDIIAQVSTRGDQALLELTEKLDKVRIEPYQLRVSAEDIDNARESADASFMDVVQRAVENIRQYQEHILVADPAMLNQGTRQLGVIYRPLDSVGVYVPGGRALYPSTVLMTVVPAQVAGVQQIALVSPPTTGGDIHSMLLALAGELGIDEVYRVGGAQAVAALALGTDTIPAVDKIVGPGNAFVSEAKRQLFGRVGIDSIAGPSEVLIIADESVKPEWVCADMLAQAEHDPGSAILVTPSEAFAQKVAAAIQVADHPTRAQAIARSLELYSAIIVVDNLEEAAAVANDFAPEHLQVMTRRDKDVMEQVRHAGAVFLGPYSPVPLGDYYAGPSHVLPTGGTSRFFSPLSCNDFRKASSVIKYTDEGLAEDADDVIDFATREGLTAHAQAVRIRRET